MPLKIGEKYRISLDGFKDEPFEVILIEQDDDKYLVKKNDRIGYKGTGHVTWKSTKEGLTDPCINFSSWTVIVDEESK